MEDLFYLFLSNVYQKEKLYVIIRSVFKCLLHRNVSLDKKLNRNFHFGKPIKLLFITTFRLLILITYVLDYPQRMRRCTEFVQSLFLYSGFLDGKYWLISVLNHSTNHQNTLLNAETKNQAKHSHIFQNFGSSLQSHPLRSFAGNPQY